MITTAQNIGEEAVNMFKEQLNEAHNYMASALLNKTPQQVNQHQNEQVESMPTMDKVKTRNFLLLIETVLVDLMDYLANFVK